MTRLLLLLLVGCEAWTPRSLVPDPNAFGEGQPGWAPQPRRENPLEVAVSPDGGQAWVSLQGSADEPGDHVVAIDPEDGRILHRVEVGSSPTGLAFHPDGRFLVVCNRFSNFVSVIDTRTGVAIQKLPADFYTTEAAFSPDGGELWLTNRWRDAVAVWELEAGATGLTVHSRHEPGIAVGSNPRDLVISADGRTVAVAALTGMSVSLIDTAIRTERARVEIGAPVNGLAFWGDHLYVATLSRSTHHQPLAGPDTDGDGRPGDSTPNINFQDLQNEIVLIDGRTGAEQARYTSDSICCKDFRDVDPADLSRHGDLLPPAETWIVGGALPEQLAIDPQGDGARLWVTYSASDQIQAFDLDLRSGELSPGPVVETPGHNPHGIAIANGKVLVAERLSETLSRFDSGDGSLLGQHLIGDVDGGEFPATDAELGELFNFVTAEFTIDGDQSCQHCHREGGNIDKALSMPLFRYVGQGLRQTMAYRGAFETRPWFFEAAMDENNFRPVSNEFARVENFCCTDPTLWPDGAPEDCATNPPAVCEDLPNAASLDGNTPHRGKASATFAHPRPSRAVTREQFFLDASARVLGRRETFGDGVYLEDPISGRRDPMPLDFDGITKSLGLFLRQDPGLLPNPNEESSATRRGQALFESATTGCAACHPAPGFAVATDHNPQGLPLQFGPVVSPNRREDGVNLDLFTTGFTQIFPLVGMETCEEVCGEDACAIDPFVCDDIRDVSFGATSLRGIWDRAPSMLHHGLAQGLREVVCTPGHPALYPGERGFNERDGIPDTHGGTSHLSARDISDLISYIESL